MHTAQPRVASRHHTQHEQVQAVCRITAATLDALLEELDENEQTRRLRRLVISLRHAGHAEEPWEGPGSRLGQVVPLRSTRI